MTFLIREASEADFPSILGLIKELADFEHASDQVTNSLELMEKEKEHFSCVVAESAEGEIIGMALWFIAYYTWVGKSLYLEDIYVKEKYRNQKVGAALLNKVFEVARAENCKRLRWQVLDWNTNAINFYKKAGAEITNEWLNCTFNELAISKFKLE